MIYDDGIDSSIKLNYDDKKIVRKIYLSYPTDVFKTNIDTEFEILNEISEHFKVAFTSIQVVGSSKTGYSYHKNKKFEPGKSDLDIAIISQELFVKYLQISCDETKQYSDLTKFLSKKDISGNDTYNSFKSYIIKGIFRPDLMPLCKEKSEWFDFFNKLTDKYFELFKSINAGIYCNQTFFEYKQINNINYYKKQKKR